MKRRDFLRTVALGTAGLTFAGRIARTARAGSTAQSARHPNILLILADDLGDDCLGCYGGKRFKTPNLDKLAATGIKFDYAFSQPLCTPTRVQLMTGIYNVRNYVRFGLLDWKQTTFANLFKKAGYATCISGKWQLEGGYEAPAHFGFDEYCLWQLNRRPERYRNPGLEINGKQVDYSNGEYGPDIVSDYLFDFMARNKDKPFLAYYPMMLPHDPHVPTPDSTDYGKPKGDGERHFADMVAYMDKLVGKAIDKLDELKIRDNTLVLFIGDNGTAGRGKGQANDAGTHVPMIASWPGVVPAGRVLKDLVDTTDFLPTMCECAGIEVPEELAIDGRSFMPQLRGEKGNPRDWVYCWYSREGGPNGAEFARNQRYTLTRDGSFFDLSRDIGEKSPLDEKSLDPEAAAARKVLQGALDKYKGARPAAHTGAEKSRGKQKQKDRKPE